MATNEILQFAETDTGTNLLTQAEYLADAQRPIGNQPGVARSKLVNKALRQASLIAAGLAEYIADNQANNVTDALTPQNIADYLQAAITGALGVTPPQFDNDTSLATTAFVQRALGSLRTLGSSNVTATMSAANVGGLYAFYGSSAGQTITLPDATAFPTGASVWFVNQASVAVTLAGNGAANISANNSDVGQTIAATLLVGKGDSIMLSYNGGGQWNVHGYTSQKQFPNSLATSGYQKLPNGLIIQWGNLSITAANALLTVTLPIAFPTGGLGGLGNAQTSTTGAAGAFNFNSFPTASQATFHNSSTFVVGGTFIVVGR